MENVKDTAELLSDELLKKALDQLDPNTDEIPVAVRNTMLKDFEQYLKRDDEIKAEMDKIQEEYKVLIEQNDEEMKKLMASMNISALIAKLENLSKLAEEIGNTKAVKHYDGLITELRSSISLDIMFGGLLKIKNPSKLAQQADTEQYNVEMKKLRTKLGNSRKYFFNDPARLLEVLSKYVTERNAKIFLYSLARFVNGTGQEGISKNAIFISQLIKNIYALDKEDFDAKEVLIMSINAYVGGILS
jgi:hypothetical protein